MVIICILVIAIKGENKEKVYRLLFCLDIASSYLKLGTLDCWKQHFWTNTFEIFEI